jgi:hypothetical protein
MSCIRKSIIQKYIDGEASPIEFIHVERHTAVCEKCAAKLTHQQQLAYGAKKALNLLSEETLPVPAMVLPVNHDKKRVFTIRRLAQMAIAACVLLFIIVIIQKKEPEKQAEIILIEPGFAPEFDANRPVSQQQIVITIIDTEGNKSEYFE